MSARLEVARLLDELPGTADDIAEVLLEKGFTGGNDGGTCPLFRYLHADEPTVEWVASEWVRVGRGGNYVPLPPAAREFVDGYDHNRYPELVRS